MKYTDRELEDILNKLIASTRSPRGRFSAASSYPQLEKKLNFRNRRLYLTRTFAAAAAVVLLCLSVWTAYLYMQPATIQTVSTLAETRTVHLPDGTSVTLNHYSSLSYPERFKSDNREVELSGEAYFEVAHNPNKPFFVEAKNLQIQVLGTSFGVRVYKDEDYALTTLEEGQVNIHTATSSVTLKPGEQAKLHDNEITVNKVNTCSYTAWRNGKYIFINEPLGNIMKTLARWYDINIFYTSSKLEQIQFTGELIRYKNIEELLSKFEILEKVKFEIRNNTITIKEY